VGPEWQYYDIAAQKPTDAKTDAIFVVDAITGLGTMPLEIDAWGLDVVVGGSQKAFMIPPGIAFVSISPKAYSLPKFIEIIPYLLIRYDNKLFMVRRLIGQTEKRLHNKYSIGIGGHINPTEKTDDIIKLSRIIDGNRYYYPATAEIFPVTIMPDKDATVSLLRLFEALLTAEVINSNSKLDSNDLSSDHRQLFGINGTVAEIKRPVIVSEGAIQRVLGITAAHDKLKSNPFVFL
jgi:hypothetical protein